MRFFREYSILFLILLFVISIEIITNNVTQESINDINEDIKELESSLESQDAKDKIKELCASWKSEEKKLSFYIEHDELEKVSVLVDNIKSNIETENIEDVNQQLSEMKFILEHIKNKPKLEWKNIF